MIDIKHTKVIRDPLSDNAWDSDILATAKNGLISVEFKAEYMSDDTGLVLYERDHHGVFSFDEEGNYDPKQIAELAKMLHSSEAAVKTMVDEIFVVMINH